MNACPPAALAGSVPNMAIASVTRTFSMTFSGSLVIYGLQLKIRLTMSNLAPESGIRCHQWRIKVGAIDAAASGPFQNRPNAG